MASAGVSQQSAARVPNCVAIDCTGEPLSSTWSTVRAWLHRCGNSASVASMCRCTSTALHIKVTPCRSALAHAAASFEPAPSSHNAAAQTRLDPLTWLRQSLQAGTNCQADLWLQAWDPGMVHGACNGQLLTSSTLPYTAPTMRHFISTSLSPGMCSTSQEDS